MESSEHKKLFALEDTYWWHVGRYSLIERLLKSGVDKHGGYSSPESRLLLNLGSGTGGTIPLLSSFGQVVNVEISLEALRLSMQKGAKLLICGSGTALPFKENCFDVVVSLDVLEHIDDDFKALAEWHRVLRPAGLIVITVPAYQWLWSAHDESLQHFRRYHAAGLHRLLNQVGFTVQRRSYAISFLLPLIVGYRLLRSLIPSREPLSSYVIVPRPINAILVLLLKFEAFLLRFTNLPFGTSVMVVARKGA